MRIYALITLLAALLATMTPQPATSARLGPATCTCLPEAFDMRVAKAYRIYTGTVRSIEIQEQMVEPGREDPPAIVTISVDEAFKDSAHKRSEVLHTSLTRVTCAGHAFEEGKTYLIYAYQRLASTYETWSLYDFKTGTYDVGGLCGGTVAVDLPAAQEELTALRALKSANDSRLAPNKPEF